MEVRREGEAAARGAARLASMVVSICSVESELSVSEKISRYTSITVWLSRLSVCSCSLAPVLRPERSVSALPLSSSRRMLPRSESICALSPAVSASIRT